MSEYQEFNKNWDELMVKTQQENEQLMKLLEEKHIKEIEENRQKMD